MATHMRAVAASAAFALLGANAAVAGVYGSLANFDVVNDTGKPAYGFEIEIEDSSYDHSKITSVFGYDRVFSFISPDPAAVVRFGKPVIKDLPGTGVRITYGGIVGGISTPSAPYTTSGESCWPGANPNWTQFSCDHFGVSTYGTPASTKYSWLVESAPGSGQLINANVAIPMVAFTPPPPPPQGQPPAPVVAVIRPQQVDPVVPQNNAFWVKITQTSVPEDVDLGDLLMGDHPGANPYVAGLEDPEIEIEWQVLQPGFVDEVSKSVDAAGDPSVVIQYEFYKYFGQFDDEGLVDPLREQIPIGDALNEFVGDYVGRQIAGFNADELAPPVPAPAPASIAMLGMGLAGVGFLRRRRKHG